MKVLKLLGCALLLSTALVVPAEGAPLVGLLFGATFATTIAGQLLGVVFGIGASLLFSTVVGALFPPSTPEQQTQQEPDTTQDRYTQVQYGERIARGATFGTSLVGGHIVHMNEFDDAVMLQYVGIIGDGKHTGIAAAYINGRMYDVTEVSVGPNNEHKRYTIAEFGSTLEIRFHDGREGQLADTDLVAQSVGWTSDKKFSNIAYFVAEIQSDREKYNGIPEIKVVPIGLVCYDPRKDTTVGGSGPHRFNNQATWEYTENPAVQAYHFCRGFFYNGKRVLGVGYSSGELAADTFITAMNICDEVVEDPGSLERPRYTCHMTFDDSDSFASVLDRLCKSMGGYHTEMHGQIAIFAGKAQSSVLTITDDDLIADEPLTFNPGRPGEFLITGIQGTYTHSQDYVPTPYASIEPEEFLSNNWYPHVITEDYPEIKNAHQAYLVAKQRLYINRLQATCVVCLDFENLVVQTNDWITWNSSSSVRGNRTYKVVNARYDLLRMRMYLALQEISAAAYDDDALPSDVEEPNRPRPIAGYIETVANLGIDGITLQGESGETLPALEFTYDPIFDPAVEGIEFSWRTSAQGLDPAGPIFKSTDRTVSDGVFRVTHGVTPGKKHEVFAHLISMPGRTTVDTVWVETVDPVSDLSTIVTVTDASIDIAKLSLDLQNLTGLLSDGGPSSIWANLANLQAEIERQANAAYTMDANYARETNMLARASSTALAAVTTERKVRVSETTALASQLTEVVASVGVISASGLLSFESEVDGGGGTGSAQIIAKVRVEIDDDFSEAAMILNAYQDGLGGNHSEAGFFVDRFFIASADGSDADIPFLFSGGVLYLGAALQDNSVTTTTIAANAVTSTTIASNAITSPKILANAVTAAKIDTDAVTTAKIQAGAVTATKISVSSLEAISATLGNVVVNGSLIVNGTLTTTKYSGNSIIAAAFVVTTSVITVNVATQTCSVSLSCNGGKVLVVVSGNVVSHSGDKGMLLYIAKNGVAQVIAEPATVLSGKKGGGTITWVDTSPGVGTNTYACWVASASGDMDHLYSSVVAENHRNA